MSDLAIDDVAPDQAGQRFLDRRLAVRPAGILRDTFLGAGADYGQLRIYGGHLLGQALAAAFTTVPEPRFAHSLHAHFLKTGRPDSAIGYQVERLRDGRHYTTRSVRALQDDTTLMIMTASFKTAEPGDEHQPPAPRVPPPEVLARRRRRRGAAALALPFTGVCGVELEAVDGWHPQAPPGGEPAITVWMRAALTAAAGLRARQCALAYLSDATMMFNALRPHGRAFGSHRAITLDHAVWFHRDPDPSAWLLFQQCGPVAADGRGLNHGRIFSAGELLASVSQEAMMRPL